MKFEIAPKETEIKSSWDDARLYCFSLVIDGKVGWRLPTKEELNEIYHSENDFEKYWYWSSTENNGYYAWLQNMSNGYYAWLQNMSNGYQASFGSKNDGGNYVRAIRDLKDD